MDKPTKAIIPEPNWKYHCDHCPKEFYSMNELIEHVKTVHFFCSKCGTGFCNDNDLLEHDFYCTGELSRDINEVREQQLSLEGIEPAPMLDYCKICGIGPFADSNAVQEHEQSCKK